MTVLLLCAFLFQDPAIDEQVRKLSSDSIEAREKATLDLSRIPLEKLPALERHLTSASTEVSARVRQAMNQVLSSNLVSPRQRFEVRPMADEATLKAWTAAGANRARTPNGFEARAFNPKSRVAGDPDWALVGPACASEKDIQEARLEGSMEFRTEKAWLVELEFKPAGLGDYKKATSELFVRTPRGKMAFVLDDEILFAPIVMTDELGLKCIIVGGFSEERAHRLIRVLKGRWSATRMRADKVKDSVEAGTVIRSLREIKGMESVQFQPDAGGVDISGYLDTSEVDFVSLWTAFQERGYRLTPKK